MAGRGLIQESVSMSRCPLNLPDHDDCPDCDGEVLHGVFSDIILPRIDEMGFPVIDMATGEIMQVAIPLVHHVGDGTHSWFDPSGIVGAACGHGLKTHPDTRVQRDWARAKAAVTWIRSKYLDDHGKCPVCYDKPAPADMLIPANA